MKWRILVYIIFVVILTFMVSSIGFTQQEPGTGYVEISGNPSFSGNLQIKFGAIIYFEGGHSFLAFGEEEDLSPLYHFELKSSWSPEPDPKTVRYIKEQGVEESKLKVFFTRIDYEAQLMMLMSEEEIRKALLSGKPLNCEKMEEKIPEEVVTDLKRLSEVKKEKYQSYQADITIMEVLGSGEILESKGSGVVQYRNEEYENNDYTHFSGRFWGSFGGTFGSGELEGNFFTVPYVIHKQDGLESNVKRWRKEEDNPAKSYREELWDGYYPVTKLSVSSPVSFDKLSHELTVELLGEDGKWYTVVDNMIQPPENQKGERQYKNEFELPRPFQAAGIRFDLHGMPFSGEFWELRVFCGPFRNDKLYREWRYIHGW